MTDTANLGLPCLDAAQEQKHVTHNEALRVLDTLVQLAVLDRDLTAPPASPGDGERWIVKATSPSGAWSGHGNHIAAWQDGGWQFSVPKVGWLAYVVDEGALIAWTGSAWADALALLTSLQNLTLLGVGTSADATNPLSTKLNNTLWTAKTVAEGGDGHLRYKMSKESAAKTLSLLLQTNFSGRAEIGLTGDDDFHFKVSADGSSWLEALLIDRSTGKVGFAQGFGDPAATRGKLYAAPFDALASNGMQVNGGMAVSQENGTSAVTLTSGAAAHVIDCWKAKFVRAATLACAAQQVSSPAPPAGLSFGLQLKATTGLNSLANGDYAFLSTPIEGYRVARLAFGGASAAPISIGFWVYATIAGTMAVALTNSAANRSIVQDVVIGNAATWEYKTVTFAGDTSGSWLTTTGIGLEARFCFGAGSTWQAAAGAWTGAEKFATSATTNFMASTNNVGIIAGVAILPGIELPTADRSAFLVRPLPEALRESQRYFQRWQQPPVKGVVVATNTILRLAMPLRVPMRSSPTLALNGTPVLYDGSATPNMSAIAASYSTPDTLEFDATAASSTLTVNRIGMIVQSGTGSIDLSARL